MRLTLQEIRSRAIQFGHNWKDETSERAEAQTFWNEFFNVFGIHRSLSTMPVKLDRIHGRTV